MKRPTIAILASGSGSTAEAFIHASSSNAIETVVGLVICNNPKAGIFDRVDRLNKQYGLKIKTLLINGRTHPPLSNEIGASGGQTAAEETAIIQALQAGRFDAISLMGYMKRIGPRLIAHFGWQANYNSPYQAAMINTHPGLLPETKGLFGIHVQQHVIDNQLPYAGHTVHVVAENYDEGPILTDHRLTVLDTDSPDTLFERVQASEKQHLPYDIDSFIKNRKRVLGV